MSCAIGTVYGHAIDAPALRGNLESVPSMGVEVPLHDAAVLGGWTEPPFTQRRKKQPAICRRVPATARRLMSTENHKEEAAMRCLVPQLSWQ